MMEHCLRLNRGGLLTAITVELIAIWRSLLQKINEAQVWEGSRERDCRAQQPPEHSVMRATLQRLQIL